MGMRWTDEMHASFLDWMEASFVERMLMGHGGGWSCGEDEEESRLPLSFLGARRPDGPPSSSSGSSEVISGPTTERRLADDEAESTLARRSGTKRPATARRALRDASEHRARRGTKTRKTSSSQRCNDLSTDLDQVVPVFEGQSSVAAAKVEKIKIEKSSSSLSSDVDFSKPK